MTQIEHEQEVRETRPYLTRLKQDFLLFWKDLFGPYPEGELKPGTVVTFVGDLVLVRSTPDKLIVSIPIGQQPEIIVIEGYWGDIEPVVILEQLEHQSIK